MTLPGADVPDDQRLEAVREQRKHLWAGVVVIIVALLGGSVESIESPEDHQWCPLWTALPSGCTRIGHCC